MTTGDPATAILGSALAAVDDELQHVVGDSPATLSEYVRDVIEAARPPLFGGVTATVADALGDGEAFERALPAAVALEAVRLQGAVHTGRLAVPPNVDSVDTQAVLAGDALYAGAVETVLSVEVTCSRRQRALEAVLAAVRETTEGRSRRSESQRRDHVSASTYLSIIRSTTGAVGATAGRLGALVAGAEDGLVADAAAYGRALGVALGVHDDVCAVLDDPSPLVRSYREMPVQTLATIHAREAGAPVDRLQLFDHDTDRLVATLRRSGSLAHTDRELRDRASTALSALESFPAVSGTARLRTLADVPVDRVG